MPIAGQLSALELKEVTRKLTNAIDALHGGKNDPQAIYTSIVCLYDGLQAHPAYQEILVDRTLLTPTTNVALMQTLMQQHLHHEEIQWFICRILSLVCQASFRFQCEAGKIGLWMQLHQIRSAHSLSLRVLETSLDTYHALLVGNEFHVHKARPAVLIIEEMLAAIDRFRLLSPSTAQDVNPTMVAKALRVLCVVYASPRLVPLLEEHNTRFMHAIVDRMLLTVDMLTKESAFAASAWLQLCLQLVKSHHEITVQLLGSHIHSDGQWIQRIPVRWGDDPSIMLDYFMILTYVFALPAHFGDVLVFDPEPLLPILFDLITKYQEKRNDERNKSDHATADMLVLEIVRLMRQWSMNAATRNRLTKERNTRSMLSTWLVSMVEQLKLPSKTPTDEQLLLEMLLTVQNFGSVPAFHSTLTASSKLLGLLQLMEKPKRESAAAKRTLSAAAPQNHHTASVKMLTKDNDIESLIIRELAKTIRLLSSPPSGSAKSSLSRTNSQSDRASRSTTKLPSKRTITSTALVAPRGR